MLPFLPLSRLNADANQTTLKHTNNKNVHKSAQMQKKVLTPLAICMLTALAGCTNDTTNSTRVIQENTKTETTTKETKVGYKTTVATPTNGAALEIYDIFNEKVVANGVIAKSTPKDTAKPTEEEQGLAVTIDINKEAIKDTSINLITLSAPKSGSATYFDPLLNQNIAFPSNCQLMMLSNGTSAVATPITTLAVYRTMAKLGWFFQAGNETKLPTPDDIKTFLKTQDANRVKSEYNLASSEVVDSLSVFTLPSITSQNDIVNFSSNTSTSNASLSAWLYMLAHLEIYTEQTGSNQATPYLSFAKDLAKDFLDGDMDKDSLNGLGNVTISLTTHKENADPNKNTIQGVYKNQFSVLNNYEAKLLKEVTNLSTKLGIQNNASTENVIERLNNTDPAYFPDSDPTFTGKSPEAASSANSVLIVPNIDDVNKMTVQYTKPDGQAVTQTVTKKVLVDSNNVETVTWEANPVVSSTVTLDTKTGRVIINNSVIKEASEIIATNFIDGTSVGSVSFFTLKNNIITYSDFNNPLLLKDIYFGIGNKTRPFGLANNSIKKLSINADPNARDSNGKPLSTDIDNLIGKYTGSNCDLIIAATGRLTLTVNGTSYVTLVDRELGDSIYRINSTDFMLNVSSKNNETSERRFIQVKTNGQTPVSASTAIATSADATALASPDAICTF